QGAGAPAGQAKGGGEVLGFGVADEPRIGMPWTRLRHDGADRQEAETKPGQRADELAVLVEARSEANGAGKVDAGEPGLEHGIGDLESGRGCEHAPGE